MRNENSLVQRSRAYRAIVNSAYKFHVGLGPGLVGKIYETCYDGIKFDEGLRLDLLIEQKVVAQIKAVDIINAIWIPQVLSQLKMTNLRFGYVINFNVPVIKDGIKRIIL